MAVAGVGGTALLGVAEPDLSRWAVAHGTPLVLDLAEPAQVFGSPAFPLVLGALLMGLGLSLGLPALSAFARLLAAGGLAAAGLAWGVRLLLSALLGDPLETLTAAAASWWPSVSVAVAFGMASVCARGAPRLLVVLAYALATTTALQRGVTGADAVPALLAGATVGLLAGPAVAALVERLWPDRSSAASAREASETSASDPDPAASSAPAPSPTAARALLGLALIVLPLMTLSLGDRDLSDPDEGRYAAVPYEMIERDDFVTPTLNGLVYFEKPPLLYWCVAGAFRAFGTSEGSARLVPVLAACVGLALAWILGRRIGGVGAGVCSVLVLATSLMWPVMGRFLVTDTLFATLVFGCLVSWWCGHVRSDGRRLTQDVVFWAIAGLAVLSKGPLALVLIGGCIGGYILACRQWRELLRPGFWASSLVGVAVAAPWFVLVSRANPGFDHHFWYVQHLGRFFGTDEVGMHEASTLFYVPFLPLMLFPWSVFLPAVLSRWPRVWPAREPSHRAAIFLASGCVFMFAFFSASSGKLYVYMLPMLPLLAVGLGCALDGLRQDATGSGNDSGARGMRRMRIGSRVAAGLLIIGAFACVVLGPPELQRLEARGPGLAVAFGLLLGGWAWALLAAARRGTLAAVMAAIAGGCATTILGLVLIVTLVMPNHSFKALYETMRPGLDAGATLVGWRGWIQSTSYYAGEPIKVFSQSGEFEFGLSQLPEAERAERFSDSLEELRDLLASPEPVYLLVWDHRRADKMRRRLEELGGLDELPVEITWNEKRSVMGNAAALAITPPQPHGVLGERREHWPE